LESGGVAQFNGLQGLFGGVGAIHPLQFFVVEALNAQAESVYAQFFPLLEVCWIDVFRVGFEGDFYAVLGVEIAMNGLKNAM
jgi:hypothetical protein